ncbi:winged helix-turn-helix domain-containing protein [Streptomyces olivochromogenes]|uniref:winged helix-turn-helix domain-containing protein n=1 Tax=Streptomyces olivochromogenes TaxID=1963 RepID=UPI001F3867BB|nr:winged helix-turn-helix domain-containing protein [Streptomyces olivochromogenes]MCF3130562.1 winged helix-turn-helix transcriptional regulator [Streptomyces olivochromogenes]
MTERGKDEGGGSEFRRVSEELRVRMADGGYPLRSFLPSQNALAEEFGVSRDTVQRVLRELRSEGWIESRQGQGSRVVRSQRIQSSAPRATRSRHPMTLGPLIGEAFEQPEVTLDIYTLTSESLDAHIRVQAERIRAGAISPDRIALRMVLPSERLELPYPRSKGDGADPRPRARLRAITERHTESLYEVLGQLSTEGLVPNVELQVRHAPLTPTFKLYVINAAEVLHGPYIPIERRLMLDGGEEIEAVDVLGLGATLTHHVRDNHPDSPGSVFVDSMTTWFEAVWNRLTEESPGV